MVKERKQLMSFVYRPISNILSPFAVIFCRKISHDRIPEDAQMSKKNQVSLPREVQHLK